MTYFKTTPIKTSRKQMCAVGSHELCEPLLLLLHQSLFLKSHRNLERSKGRTLGDPDIPRAGKPMEESSEEPPGGGLNPRQGPYHLLWEHPEAVVNTSSGKL